MNIDNALYTLNIAPDARQLTVFIDGEAIPQSRPKIATRGKTAFLCLMLSPTIKTLLFTTASSANTVLSKLFKSRVSFLKMSPYFVKYIFFYLSLRQKVRSLKPLLMSAQNFQKSSRTAITFLKISQTQPRAWHSIQIAALFL